MKILSVPKLSVQVVTGDTCYAHENGFSAIYAEVVVKDSSLIDALAAAQREAQVITLRCAMLDVKGRITNLRSAKGVNTFVLCIDDLAYRKPGSAGETSN